MRMSQPGSTMSIGRIPSHGPNRPDKSNKTSQSILNVFLSKSVPNN